MGAGVFTSAFLVEEIASGLRAVSHGRREAALSQGFTPWQELRFILLPQGLGNAWQPIVGQYLNLMKLIAGQRHRLCGTDLSGAAD